MLSRISQRRLLQLTQARSISHVPGTPCIVPSSVEDIVKYLDRMRPEYTCLYFHASWNPWCKKVENDYHDFCARNAGWTHVKVNCDETPKIKFYFDARVEPQCLLLLNGREVKRQVGWNFNLVEEHLNEAQEFHLVNADYHGDSGHVWERFYDDFDRWAKYGQGDRDAMMMRPEDGTDQHRGPGTSNL